MKVEEPPKTAVLVYLGDWFFHTRLDGETDPLDEAANIASMYENASRIETVNTGKVLWSKENNQ